MVTNTWRARRKMPGSASPNRTTALLQFANAAELAQVADTLSQNETAGRLRQLCERWIYTTCLCFALDLEEQKRGAFHYQYSVYQMEYSRNLLFRSGGQMDRVFQALIDRSRSPLDLDRIKTIFGDKKRPHYDKRKKESNTMGSRGRDTCL
jgi:hypothetical protein